uniref:Nuclear envelope integral membrane protein 2 n=1 Tax=Erpetoichthys calabaricus TaxID=27687 RepID=A0A8C4RZC9_ERPCA
MVVVAVRWAAAGLVLWLAATSSVSGYPVAGCTDLRVNKPVAGNGEKCFCFNSAPPGWADLWSTFQVTAQSNEDDNLKILLPVEDIDCRYPETFAIFVQCIRWKYLPPPKPNHTISRNVAFIDDPACFKVLPFKLRSSYTVLLRGRKLDVGHFATFAAGVFLLFRARALCRSAALCYLTGICLGVLSPASFLLLVFRSRIPARGLLVLLLLLSSCASYLVVQQIVSRWDAIQPMYQKYMSVYLLCSGLLSLAVCYKRGPISSPQVLNGLTWALRTVAVALLYRGFTHPTASNAIVSSALVVAVLPLAFRAFKSALTQQKPSKAHFRFLSEEEYREQGAAETRAALQGLREHSRSPLFPMWEVVHRLQSPKRFAAFVQGAPHVTPEERQAYDQHYGAGGAYYEPLIPRSENGMTSAALQGGRGDEKEEEDDDDDMEYSEPMALMPAEEEEDLF